MNKIETLVRQRIAEHVWWSYGDCDRDDGKPWIWHNRDGSVCDKLTSDSVLKVAHSMGIPEADPAYIAAEVAQERKLREDAWLWRNCTEGGPSVQVGWSFKQNIELYQDNSEDGCDECAAALAAAREMGLIEEEADA